MDKDNREDLEVIVGFGEEEGSSLNECVEISMSRYMWWVWEMGSMSINGEFVIRVSKDWFMDSLDRSRRLVLILDFFLFFYKEVRIRVSFYFFFIFLWDTVYIFSCFGILIYFFVMIMSFLEYDVVCYTRDKGGRAKEVIRFKVKL